ncbi:hypothetical protein CPC16_006903 [Podila verticillata]|nr:hypothetical protein CPC16_006903 [Podila verticillata]
MRISVLSIASAIAATTIAVPMSLAKRDTASDSGVLNYAALTLENLEDEFYKQGLAKYNESNLKNAGFDTKIWDHFSHINEHEATHVTILTSVIKSLNGSPVPACKCKFPLDSLASFLAVAQVLENTSTSVYLGAASELRDDLLTAAATITTFGIPYVFDTSLNHKQIVTIASNFITSCPNDLGVMPFTQLTASLPAKGSSKVKTSFTGDKGISNTWCQFLYDNKVSASPPPSARCP